MLHDVLGPSNAGVVEIVRRGFARKYSNAFGDQLASGWFKSISQPLLAESLRSRALTFTGQSNIFPLKDFRRRYSERGNRKQLCGQI